MALRMSPRLCKLHLSSSDGLPSTKQSLLFPPWASWAHSLAHSGCVHISPQWRRLWDYWLIIVFFLMLSLCDLLDVLSYYVAPETCGHESLMPTILWQFSTNNQHIKKQSQQVRKTVKSTSAAFISCPRHWCCAGNALLLDPEGALPAIHDRSVLHTTHFPAIYHKHRIFLKRLEPWHPLLPGDISFWVHLASVPAQRHCQIKRAVVDVSRLPTDGPFL